MAFYELHDRPSLESPVLVMVLEGWIDSGHAAGAAAQTLLTNLRNLLQFHSVKRSITEAFR